MAGCKKEEFPEPANKQMIGSQNTFALETRYLSHAGKELNVEMDIGAFYGGMAYDDIYLADSAFKSQNATGFTINVQQVQRIKLEENKSYSNIILVDLSEGDIGTWQDFDLFNLRNRALNRAMQEGHENPANEIALASFARTGEGEPAYKIRRWSEGNGFEQNYESKTKSLFTMYNEQEGTNSLYDALDYMIDYSVSYSKNTNKNITVITYSIPDDNNTVSSLAVINKAKKAGVKINIISLTDYYTANMISVATRTGGFVNMVSSTPDHVQTKGDIMDKGTLMLSSMHRILAKNLHVYRVKMQLTKTSGNWQSINAASNFYHVSEHYPDGSSNTSNYLPFYVQVP